MRISLGPWMMRRRQQCGCDCVLRRHARRVPLVAMVVAEAFRAYASTISRQDAVRGQEQAVMPLIWSRRQRMRRQSGVLVGVVLRRRRTHHPLQSMAAARVRRLLLLNRRSISILILTRTIALKAARLE